VARAEVSTPGGEERPRWTFHFERVGRNRRKPRPIARTGGGGSGFQWFSWIVLAVLVIEVAVLVWQGFLPR
jgi:hypothetical protein